MKPPTRGVTASSSSLSPTPTPQKAELEGTPPVERDPDISIAQRFRGKNGFRATAVLSNCEKKGLRLARPSIGGERCHTNTHTATEGRRRTRESCPNTIRTDCIGHTASFLNSPTNRTTPYRGISKSLRATAPFFAYLEFCSLYSLVGSATTRTCPPGLVHDSHKSSTPRVEQHTLPAAKQDQTASTVLGRSSRAPYRAGTREPARAKREKESKWLMLAK